MAITRIKLLKNRSVLYAIAGLCAVFLGWMLASSQIHVVIFFALVAGVSSYFTRNMTIILSVALASAGSVCIGIRSRRYEGLENAGDSEKTADADAEEEDGVMDDQIRAGIAALKETKDVGKAKSKLKEAKASAQKPDEPDETDAVPPAEPFRPNQSKFTKQTGSRIDYASTLEESYNYLDKILSSDGVGKLTADTQKLMHQQQNLFNTMTNMTGMLKNTKDMMKTLNVDGLSKMASSAISSGK